MSCLEQGIREKAPQAVDELEVYLYDCIYPMWSCPHNTIHKTTNNNSAFAAHNELGVLRASLVFSEQSLGALSWKTSWSHWVSSKHSCFAVRLLSMSTSCKRMWSSEMKKKCFTFSRCWWLCKWLQTDIISARCLHVANTEYIMTNNRCVLSVLTTWGCKKHKPKGFASTFWGMVVSYKALYTRDHQCQAESINGTRDHCLH